MKETRKVKSIQMFRKTRESAMQGDRVGICVTQFDPKLIERGIVCSPGALPLLHAAIAIVIPISHYKGDILTKAKFHISLGHETVMASCHFFGCEISDAQKDKITTFEWNEEYVLLDKLDGGDGRQNHFVLLRFERPISVPLQCLIIGSKLDMDIHKNACRLAFHGTLLQGIEPKNYAETVLPSLKIFKVKRKEGIVERKLDNQNVIVKSLFKKETNVHSFSGLKVNLSTGECGTIEGSFGQSGKTKVYIPGEKSEIIKFLL